MLHEHYLLIIAINELKLTLRLADRERQTRKAGACAHIENALTVQKRPGNQAVEQMSCDHLGRIANSGQIDLLVPARKLVEQGREFFIARHAGGRGAIRSNAALICFNLLFIRS